MHFRISDQGRFEDSTKVDMCSYQISLPARCVLSQTNRCHQERKKDCVLGSSQEMRLEMLVEQENVEWMDMTSTL
jgi:hypothetical protein